MWLPPKFAIPRSGTLSPLKSPIATLTGNFPVGKGLPGPCAKAPAPVPSSAMTFLLVRTSKYLNNTIEQDHRRVKQRLGPMLGLKSFRIAAIVIGGIELAEKIKKGQFKIGKLRGPIATMPEIWQATLAA